MNQASVSEKHITDLEDLVNELSKGAPKEDKVQRLMDNLGLNYSRDPIERLELVLRAMSFGQGNMEMEE